MVAQDAGGAEGPAQSPSGAEGLAQPPSGAGAGESRRPLLTLEMLEPERDFVLIDGEACELVARDELSLLDRARVHRLGLRVSALFESEDPTDVQEAVASDALNEIARLLLPRADGEVLAKLSDGQRLELMQVFTSASAMQMLPALLTMLGAAPEGGYTTGPPAPSTGDASSPGSSSASAETSAAG